MLLSESGRDEYFKFLDKYHPQSYRREQITALARAIRARENRLLMGLPGVGVSTLLRFLVTHKPLVETLAQKPVTITFAYITCETLVDPHDHDLFFDKISRQLSEQGLGEIDQSTHGVERLEWLLMRMDGEPWHRVVLVADNADQLLADVERGFYRNLKGLTDINQRLCWILAIQPRTAKRVDPDNWLFAGSRMFVSRLNERDFRGAIAEEALRLGVEFNSAQQERLIHLLGGHPGLLRAVSSAVVHQELDLLASEDELIERLLHCGDVKAHCQRIWDTFSPSQEAALHKLASRKSTIAADTLKEWRDFGLVEQRAGQYRLFSPLFEKFVAKQEVVIKEKDTGPLKSVEIRGATEIKAKNGQQVVVAGQVFKNGQEVHVSPLELRLIACLMRERRIYTQNEIADYVYYEEQGIISSSTISNLVRQVRHRLGNKAYIKAHWGQGYEFMG